MEKYCRAGQASDDNMAHADCVLNTKSTNTHTQVVQFSLLFHCNNICTNTPQCHVIRTLPVFCLRFSSVSVST